MIAEDLVSTIGSLISGGLYPSVAPNGVTAPYGVYTLVAGVPQSYVYGAPNLTNSRYQVDLFARDKATVDTLAETVKAAMDAATLFKSVCQLQQDIFEDPAAFYRVTLDFSIWH